MPDLTLTAPGLRILFSAGQSRTIRFEFPAGALEDRTFTAALSIDGYDDIVPTVEVDGDAIEVSVTAVDTADLYERGTARFELTDTSLDPAEPVIIGTARATRLPDTPTTSEVTVVDQVAHVAVRILSGGQGVAGASGAPGVGVPTAGSTGEVLLKTSGTDFDTTWAQLTAADVGAVSRTGGGREPVVLATSVSGDYTPNLDLGAHFVLTLSGDARILMPAVANGELIGFTCRVYANGHSLTYDAAVTPETGVPPTLGTKDLLGFICEGVNTAWTVLHYNAPLAIGNNSVRWKVASAPAIPPSGEIEQWFDATLNKFLWMGHDGVIHEIGATVATTTGVISQVSGQAASGRDFAAAGSFALVLPSTPTSGNMLLMAVQTDLTGTLTATGWTKDAELVGSFGRVAIYRKTSTGVIGDKTATVTFSGTKYVQMFVTELTGQHASPLDQTATNSGSGTTLSVVTGATTQASEYAFFATYTASGTFEVSFGSSGFGLLYDGGLGIAASKALSATGAVTASVTVNTSPTEILGAVATYKAA